MNTNRREWKSGKAKVFEITARPMQGATAVLLVFSLVLPAMPATAASAGGWGIAFAVENQQTYSAEGPSVGFDASGNAMVVYRQWTGADHDIWSNRYVAGVGWGTPAAVDVSSYDTSFPAVSVGANGDAVAVWFKGSATVFSVWSNQFVPGVGWGTAALLELDDTDHALDPQVAVDPNGNAVAVWAQGDGTRQNIWARRYVPGTGWGTGALIETDNAGSAYVPQVVVDAGGNASAVWYQWDGSQYSIFSNRFVPGTGWGTGAVIETDNTGGASSPRIVSDGNGGARAVWHQSDGSRNNIWSSRFAPGAGWGTPALVETDNSGGADYADVASDGHGNSLAVWEQWDGSRYNIWGNRYAQGVGWGMAGLLETGSGTAQYPRVVMDGDGNGIAVWYQSGGSHYDAWANRYVAGVGWGTPTLLETDNFASPSSPRAAVDNSGNVLAVWSQNDGLAQTIFANWYTAIDIKPPVLALASPAIGAATNVSSVWVSGTTEPGASISANGVSAAVASNGSFGLLVGLRPGANAIAVTAWDAAGNNATAMVTVTYNDPFSALEQEFGAAQSDLAAAQARVASLEANASAEATELDTAKADLTAAQARVTTLESSLSATRAQLTDTQTQLTTTRADLNATKAQMPSGGTGGSVTEAQVAAAQMYGMLGIILGLVGLVVGALGIAMGRRAGMSKTAGASTKGQQTEPPK